ncbi:MAG TPA: helix-turn-helix transcriptional regulator [Candidatus Paceibacterota bacterium]|nr:helix-turn-helix transcriptional regulator [Candidatus Paceibacterota bacterium]
MDISAKFGKRVRATRLKKKISQADVAKLLGVHRSFVSQIERGVVNLSLKNIEKLARALGVSPDKLLR